MTPTITYKMTTVHPTDGWTISGYNLTKKIYTTSATETNTTAWLDCDSGTTATSITYSKPVSEYFYYHGTDRLIANDDGTWTEVYPECRVTWEPWGTATYGTDCKWHEFKELIKSPAERLLEIIRDRQGPAIHTSRKSLPQRFDEREMRARETLRLILGEERFRRFVKDGFVTATNPISGYTYQIFHSTHHLTHVYKDGKMVNRLCIYMKGDFPPTDFVITMYLMALNNDQQIWQIANKNQPVERKLIQKINGCDKPLTEIFKELKSKAA